jgi:hypothetical protein
MAFLNSPRGPYNNTCNEYIKYCNNEIVHKCRQSKVITDSWNTLKNDIAEHIENIDIKDTYSIIEDKKNLPDRLLLNILGVRYLIQLRFTTFDKAKIYYIKISDNITENTTESTIENTIHIHAHSPNQNPIIESDGFTSIAIEDLKYIHASFVSNLGYS